MRKFIDIFEKFPIEYISFMFIASALIIKVDNGSIYDIFYIVISILITMIIACTIKSIWENKRDYKHPIKLFENRMPSFHAAVAFAGSGSVAIILGCQHIWSYIVILFACLAAVSRLRYHKWYEIIVGIFIGVIICTIIRHPFE